MRLKIWKLNVWKLNVWEPNVWKLKIWKLKIWKLNVWRSLTLFLACCVLCWGTYGGVPGAIAAPLADRMAQYPNWTSPPTTRPTHRDDLAYPDWFLGTWQATSTLTDLVAPLAPEVSSPGFEGNRTLLNQPVNFEVRFVSRRSRQSWVPALPGAVEIVSDRAFNGLNIAKAYLGEDLVVRVEADPQDPNTQVTTLQGNRTLVSTIPARAIETPSDQDFITSEIFQQVFRGQGTPYLNQVETTTAYHYQPAAQTPAQDQGPGGEPTILADQVTAVYLSPQDENYFKAVKQPIALYRYRLELRP